MVLDLRGQDAHFVPIARQVGVIDVTTLHLVGTERRPPDVPIRELGEEQRDALREHECVGRFAVRDGRDEPDQVFVCQSRRARKIKHCRRRGGFKGVNEGLGDVYDLRRSGKPRRITRA